jgi:hypothetical protein
MEKRFYEVGTEFLNFTQLEFSFQSLIYTNRYLFLCVYFTKYCDGLLKTLRYGSRKPRVTRPTIELRLFSNEGLNNHDNRGTIEDVS